jgi:hypothetical protein
VGESCLSRDQTDRESGASLEAGASCTEPYPEYAELARDTSQVAAYNSSVLRGDLHERLN